MILLVGALLWLCAMAFVLALCKAASDGDRRLRDEMTAARTRVDSFGPRRRERVTVG